MYIYEESKMGLKKEALTGEKIIIKRASQVGRSNKMIMDMIAYLKHFLGKDYDDLMDVLVKNSILINSETSLFYVLYKVLIAKGISTNMVCNALGYPSRAKEMSEYEFTQHFFNERVMDIYYKRNMDQIVKEYLTLTK